MGTGGGGGGEEDPEGSHSQNVRGELGWGVVGLFILYFLRGDGEGGGKCFCARAWDLLFFNFLFLFGEEQRV